MKSGSKKIFRTGIIALLPTLITIFILALVFNFLNNNISKPLGKIILNFISIVIAQRGEAFIDTNLGFTFKTLAGNAFWQSILGMPIAIFLVFITGLIIGKKIQAYLDKLLKNIPLIGSIYPRAKEFIEFLFESKRGKFQSVVFAPWPSKGRYAVAFRMNELHSLNEATSTRYVSVFIPSTPTPFTGFLTFVPESELLPCSLTFDQAVTMLLSGGVVVPPEERVIKVEEALLADESEKIPEETTRLDAEIRNSIEEPEDTQKM